MPAGAPAHGRTPSLPNGTNGTAAHSASPDAANAQMPPASAGAKVKKAKAKKAVDPNETGKLLAAKINQLELDAAGEKDQEQEIGELDSTSRRICGKRAHGMIGTMARKAADRRNAW
jgi:hypothetical protein